MVRASHIVTTLIALLMILPGMVCGVDTEISRKTIKGLKGVRVQVAPIEPEIEKAGLTRSQIRTDVELKLRLTGLNVLTPKISAKEDESIIEDAWPRIHVYAVILNASSGASAYYVFNIDLELIQLVYLARNNKPAWATTWSTGGTGHSNELEKIRSAIKDSVDVFLNAWLSVNPK